ncbi:hypothetical protein L596_012735 [Steinernema carpocapsae]|uniref:RNA helicase n=1 Tax=Steinernema carpocapsae TaxID=34508 RepID=A0A4V6A4W1_STECR|nr:hypothetical protein L596_012735 [Steinernema carpocapsae]
MAQYRRVVAARNETDFNECKPMNSLIPRFNFFILGADMTVGHGIYTARLTGPTGKGNGMSGNAHLSQENRIGMGDKFKDLRKVENISIEGGGPQGKRRTIDKFSECNIDRRIIANLNEVGIREPTAVQRAVLPIMLNDTEHDLLAQAETGSGKTAAYLIPIVCHIQRMKNNGHLPKPNSPYSVIVAPTRELAGQIAHEARVISEGIGISVALSYGQMHMGECRKAIAAGCDILVATPGRLIGHYEERSVHFKSIRWIVLDEADQMFDYSLGQFVVPFLKESLKNSHGVRLFAFSATFTAGVICTMEKNYLKPDYYVVTGRAAPKDNIKQRFVECQRNQKKTFLLLLMNKILRKANRESRGPRVKIPKTIIFVDTKFETNYLAIYLTNLGISCISFNGDRTQLMREKAIDDFSRGHFSVMVCTNVCARGLNMKNVEYVINYDIPFKCQEMFLHRIGRTGRAGNVGTAYTFFERGRDEKNIEEITAMIEDCGIEVPDFIAKIKEERENRIVGCFHGNED